MRSPDEFSGKILAPPGLPETCQRGGHLPGARNIPWATACNDDGTFSQGSLAAPVLSPLVSVDESEDFTSSQDLPGDKDVQAGSSDSSCEGCDVLTLSWDPNPERVIGYFVYRGSNPGAATELISDISVTFPDFHSSSPSVQYDVLKDLGIQSGESVCFRIKAYSEVAVSDYSEAACATV